MPRYTRGPIDPAKHHCFGTELPLEAWQNICNRLSPEDIRALRETCRDAEDFTFNIFAGQFTHIIIQPAHDDSLDTAIGISGTAGIGNRVLTLGILVDHVVRDKPSKTRLLRKHEHDARSMTVRPGNTRLGIIFKQFRKSGARIRRLYFTTREELPLPGILCGMKKMMKHDALFKASPYQDQVTFMTARAIVESGVAPPEDIDFRFTGYWAFPTHVALNFAEGRSLYTALFRHVRSLDLGGWMAKLGPFAITNARRFAAILSSIPNLEKLIIRNGMSQLGSNAMDASTFANAVLRQTLPRLQTFDLIDAKVHFRLLIEFVQIHDQLRMQSVWLETVELEGPRDGVLVNEEPEPALKRLTGFRNIYAADDVDFF